MEDFCNVLYKIVKRYMVGRHHAAPEARIGTVSGAVGHGSVFDLRIQGMIAR